MPYAHQTPTAAPPACATAAAAGYLIVELPDGRCQVADAIVVSTHNSRAEAERFAAQVMRSAGLEMAA